MNRMKPIDHNEGRRTQPTFTVPFFIAFATLAATGLLAWFLLPTNHRCMADETPATNKSGEEHKYSNELVHETSPYLLQHAHNPVNWHPWGENAFKLARQQNKPIFLSVGYSTCYWCHVMERESFEDEEVAEVINEHYIAIKVDREELPDVDEQYMLATQLMTGRGGWPNSLWLTPDGRPWMAGTYFPKERFVPLLMRLAEVWQEQPEAVKQQAQAVSQAIEQATAGPGAAEEHELNQELVDAAVQAMEQSFDEQHAGFGGAPKFPPHGRLRVLAHEAERLNNPALTAMLVQTLDAMWQGGIHDHVGGGFHRYATDDHWFLPHFEKMLYDNAQLMRAYADGYSLSGEERYRRAVDDIHRWIEREMTAPAGGFYSALDSESDGEEGLFYVWTKKEVEKILGSEDGNLFAEVYGFESGGNFTIEATGERPGTNLPYLPKSIEEFAREQGFDFQKLEKRLAPMRDKLLAARNKRPFPHRDDKILTSWNGLMISALAYAGQQIDDPRYIKSAANAADFILKNMHRDEMLLRTYRADEARVNGYLDDYAFFIRGLLQLYKATNQPRWLENAQSLTDLMIDKFWDAENGGFFFTSDQHDELISRSKNLLGGGNTPSPNGVAAESLLMLAAITDDARYQQYAQETLQSLSGVMATSPGQADSMIYATALLLNSDNSASDMIASREDGADADAEKADLVYRKEPVSVQVYASETTVRPGQEIALAVSLDIAPSWHLYGSNPEAEFIVPTTLSVAPSDSFAAGEIQPPQGVFKDDEVLGKRVETYAGRIWFRLPVTVSATAEEGEHVLELQLRVQACDQNRCLPPDTTTLQLPVTVAADALKQARHPSIFESATD